MVKTLVLIHGYGFDSRIWYPVELAFEGFRVIYLSLPGFGTESPAKAYTIEDLAQQFWQTLELANVSAVHLAGHSMGGYVVMEMIAQHPERVASLALVHSHVFEDTADKKRQRTGVAEKIKLGGREDVVRNMIPSLFADPGEAAEIINALVTRGMQYDDLTWLNGALAMRDRKDHAKTLTTFTGPVLLIMGAKDVAVTASQAYSQASLSGNTELLMYADTGHMAMYERTGTLIKNLINFYRRIK